MHGAKLSYKQQRAKTMKNVYKKMFDEDKSGFASNKDNNYSVPKADNRNSNDQNVQGSLNFQMNKMINN